MSEPGRWIRPWDVRPSWGWGNSCAQALFPRLSWQWNPGSMVWCGAQCSASFSVRRCVRWSSRANFSNNRSEIFSAYVKACIATGESLFPPLLGGIRARFLTMNSHSISAFVCRKDGCLVRPRFAMVRIAVMQRTAWLCESGVTSVKFRWTDLILYSTCLFTHHLSCCLRRVHSFCGRDNCFIFVALYSNIKCRGTIHYILT